MTSFRARTRLVAALLVAVAGLVAAASPAAAHGSASGAEVPNYVSEFTDPGHAGLRWSLDAQHSMVELTNNTGDTVTVLGYQDEPYLRFDPDGTVSENTASPSAYLSTDRYGDAVIPPTASAAAEPTWQIVADNHRYRWYDHRTHWMSRVQPPEVTDAPDRVHLLDQWEIPVQIGDNTQTVALGVLRWEPDLAWWPPMLILTVIATGIVAAALVTTRPDGTAWPQPAAALAAILALVAAANAVRTVDEVASIADSTSGRLVVAISGGVALTAIGALIAQGRRGNPGGYAALAGAAWLTAIIFGGQAWPEITSPQFATSLPEWTRRWTIAASFVVAVPGMFTLVAAGRRFTNDAHSARADEPATPTQT